MTLNSSRSSLPVIKSPQPPRRRQTVIRVAWIIGLNPAIHLVDDHPVHNDDRDDFDMNDLQIQGLAKLFPASFKIRLEPIRFHQRHFWLRRFVNLAFFGLRRWKLPSRPAARTGLRAAKTVRRRRAIRVTHSEFLHTEDHTVFSRIGSLIEFVQRRKIDLIVLRIESQIPFLPKFLKTDWISELNTRSSTPILLLPQTSAPLTSQNPRLETRR